MNTDPNMETITDPAEIRASDEPDERRPTGPDDPWRVERTTPAPSSGAGLDMDAIEAMVQRGALYDCDSLTLSLVAEVRRLTEFRDWWKASSLANAEDVRGITAIAHEWRARAESAEAEVVEMRAKVAAVEALGSFDAFLTVAPITRVRVVHEHDLRAALATTGEGQRPNCDTCNDTGRCDWMPGEHRDTDEWDRPCIDHCKATTGEGQ